MENTYPFLGLVPLGVLRDHSVVGRRQMEKRRSHGFIIKLAGKTEYRLGGNTWLLEAGQVLFVAKGSSYEIQEVSPGYSYVVNFECTGQWDQALQKLQLPKNFELRSPADKLYHCWQNGEVYNALSALYKILEATQVPLHSQHKGTSRLLEPVLDYIRDNLTNPDLELQALSKLADVSDAYLRRLFKKHCGLSPAGYVLHRRMELAKKLLTEQACTVADVAIAVGYRDPLYFSRLFRRQVGLSPTQYRRTHMEDLF